MSLFVTLIKDIPIIKNVEPIIYLILSRVLKESKAVFANACTIFTVILILIGIKRLVYIFILV
jgi:hypothetical protein